MKKNSAKILFGFLIPIINIVLIGQIIYYTFIHNVFSQDEMFILTLVIAPLTSVYIPMFSSYFHEREDIKNDTNINISAYIFYIFIIAIIFSSLTVIIYMKYTGDIQKFSTTVFMIGAIEITLGVSIGSIIKSLYFK